MAHLWLVVLAELSLYNNCNMALARLSHSSLSRAASFFIPTTGAYPSLLG